MQTSFINFRKDPNEPSYIFLFFHLFYKVDFLKASTLEPSFMHLLTLEAIKLENKQPKFFQVSF